MSHKRIIYLDILNIIACISVLLLHHNGLVHHYENSSAWSQSLIVEVLCYFAVPVFFMLSGASLLDYEKRYDTVRYFKARVKRTVFPFLLWTLIWGVLTKGIFKVCTFADFVNDISQSKYCNVYWFFLPLFFLYLLIPFLSRIVPSRNLHKFYIVIFFVMSSFIPLLNRIFNLDETVFSSNSGMYVCMYALVGNYFVKYKIGKGLKICLYISALLCVAGRYVLTWYISHQTGQTYAGLSSYAYFTSALPAFAVFYAVKDFISGKTLESNVNSIILKLSACSFGIYLLHPFFVYHIWPNLLRLFNIEYLDSIIYRIFLVPVTYVCCLVISLYLKRISIFKYLLP